MHEYSTIRVITAELLEKTKARDTASLGRAYFDEDGSTQLWRATREMNSCIEEFFERCELEEDEAERSTTAVLIKQNLAEPGARHLMLLTKDNAALRLLFESNLVDHGRADVMFGSTFPNDQLRSRAS